MFYYLSMLAFLFSILSKGQAVMLPFCLILLDHLMGKPVFALSNLRKLAPFFLIALAMGIVALVSQQSTGYTGDQSVSFSLAGSIVYPSYAFVMYLSKIFFPLNLSAWYAYPEGGLTFLTWLCVPLFLAYLGLIIWFWKRNPWLSVGMGFFLINILPFLKWIPVSNYIIADRYVYLSGLGIFMLFGYAVVWLLNKKPSMKWPIMAGILLIAILFAVQSSQRVKVWNNSLSLLNDILEKDPNVYTALNSRGDVYKDLGKNEAALADFDAAIRLRPDFARAYGNRGTLIAGMGDCETALPDLNKALELDPNLAGIHVNRARCLNLRGNFKEALIDLDQARALGFRHSVLEYETGIAYYNMRDFQTALGYFNNVAEKDPAYPSVYTYRGFAHFHQGNLTAAINDLNLSIAQNPDNAVAWAIRGLAKARTNDPSACDDLKRAEKMGLLQVKNDLKRYCGEN